MSNDDDDEIRPGKVLNAPETIYLVIGELDGQDIEFRDMEEVTWCADSVYRDDIRYVRATPLVDAAKDLLEALQELTDFVDYVGPTRDPSIQQALAAINKATKGDL